VLVETLSLTGITKHINKFLCKAAQKRSSGVATHTSGFDCNWLKAIFEKYFQHFAVYAYLNDTVFQGYLQRP